MLAWLPTVVMESPGGEHIPPSRTRHTQNVVSLYHRAKVVNWMKWRMAQNDGITSTKMLKDARLKFPNVFRTNDAADRERARVYYKEAESFLISMETQRKFRVSRGSKGFSVSRSSVKARRRSGRPRHAWVIYLHDRMFEEFFRLEALGVKMNTQIFVSFALRCIQDNNGPFGVSSKDPTSDRLISSHITPHWVRSFFRRFEIVHRVHRGKKLISGPALVLYEKNVSAFLGSLKQRFETGELNENDVANMDESHFIFDMDDRRTLAVRGSTSVNYVDVVSGTEGMSMVLLLSGGPNAKLYAPFMIFKNALGSYPITGVPDDVEGVSYRTNPTAWMNREMFSKWLQEPRAIAALPDGRTRHLFMDNCPGHNSTLSQEQSLAAISTSKEYLVKKSTHHLQPLDFMIIKAVKNVWRKKWYEERARRTENQDFTTGTNASGMLRNPGKSYYLRLAAECVQEVNDMKDSSGMSLCRKAMIKCGLSLPLDGIWKKEQLRPDLQTIINKYPQEFSDGATTMQ